MRTINEGKYIKMWGDERGKKSGNFVFPWKNIFFFEDADIGGLPIKVYLTWVFMAPFLLLKRQERWGAALSQHSLVPISTP